MKLTELKPLNESGGAMLFASTLRDLVSSGTLTSLQAVLIYTSVVASTVGLIFSPPNLLHKLKQNWRDHKEKQHITQSQVDQLVSDANTTLKNIKEPGKRKYLTGLVNKYKTHDVSNKETMLQIKRDIEHYINNHK